MRTCHFHDDRPGVGICMRCRAIVCAACCTRLDGVNHCHACLKALGKGRDEPRSAGGFWVVAAGLTLAAALAVLFGLSWAVSGTLAP